MTSAAAQPTPLCPCRPAKGDLPSALLTARLSDEKARPALLAATVDYELGSWRAQAFANHILEWVLDYALRRGEREHLSPGRVVEITKRAMKATFGNGHDRGVPGEILLHAVCRQFFGSDTVINKVWFKTANNDTYKGFDGVHAVHSGNTLELWLGEAKFYRNADRAIQAVVGELDDHLDRDYLRGEFALVASKIDDDHPHAAELRQLMHPNSSLDQVFDRIVVPILLTYDSASTLGHTKVCPEYDAALEAEVRRIWLKLTNRLPTTLPVAVRLFLVPLADKTAVENALHAELQKWQ